MVNIPIHRVGTGGWSSEGIQVISNITKGNVTTVLCNSTHLTSFAVLVDVAGGLEVSIPELNYLLCVLAYNLSTLYNTLSNSTRIIIFNYVK